MTHLELLKSAKTRHDVAALLGYKAAALSFILYKKSDASKYTTFDIPKRYGGTRKICAPLPELKLVQQRLSDSLQNCVEEINKASGFEDQISHGFKRKRSILTNAKQHRNRKFVFNVDLKDFFGSINFGRIRGFFIKDKNFSLHADVATVLAQIACFENALPQGSPCSPVISNLIGHVLDIHLVRLAFRCGCTYSRYADDLTFSTNKPNFPTRIAKCIAGDEHKWQPGNELARLVKKAGFDINPQKTRMQYHDSRQEVTGLVVNKKVNVRTEYRHTVRAMVHRLFTTGSFEFVRQIVDEAGAVSLVKESGTTNQLRGMLGFIDGIDRYNKKLVEDIKGSKEHVSLTSKESMYRRFLLFTEFYTAPAPVIICEGKTDNVYILHAIRSLAALYPALATRNASDGKINLNVRIFKYSGKSTGRILKLYGGTGDLGHLLLNYNSEVKRFKAPGGHQPILILIDNDSGAAPLYKIVGQITGIKPNGTEPFIPVTGNMYMVPTPQQPGQAQTMIEDFFDAAAKSMTVSGKTFNPKNEMDTKTQYGKNVFTHKVVRANA